MIFPIKVHLINKCWHIFCHYKLFNVFSQFWIILNNNHFLLCFLDKDDFLHWFFISHGVIALGGRAFGRTFYPVCSGGFFGWFSLSIVGTCGGRGYPLVFCFLEDCRSISWADCYACRFELFFLDEDDFSRGYSIFYPYFFLTD